MPLVKQSIFKEYYKSCEEIKQKADACHNSYFDEDGNYNCCNDVFTDFFYDVDDIYDDARKLKNKLENLLEISEQKTIASIERCKECIADMRYVIDACKRDFREVYDLLNGNFSAIEEETFKNYKIFQEI